MKWSASSPNKQKNHNFFDNHLLKDPPLITTPRSELEKCLISIRRAFTCAYSKSEDRSDHDKDHQKPKKTNNSQGKSSKKVKDQFNNLREFDMFPVAKKSKPDNSGKVETQQQQKNC